MSRVLIVDDDAGQRSLLESAVSNAGVETHCVDVGKAALEVLDQGAWDLVISDVKMPDVDGFELIKAIRERGQERNRGRTAGCPTAPSQNPGVRNYRTGLFWHAHVHRRTQTPLAQLDDIGLDQRTGFQQGIETFPVVAFPLAPTVQPLVQNPMDVIAV